jgi:hypothetical protein
MASFGSIGSANPNVLFDPMAVDQALQQRRQNALLLDMQREDQQFQRENQAQLRANGGMTPYQRAQLDQQREGTQALYSALGVPAPGGAAPAAAPAAPGAASAGSGVNVPPVDGRWTGPADDLDAMTRTIIGEAGNQGDAGMRAVGHVIANRSQLTGQTPLQVVLAPNQFEPWAKRGSELMAVPTDSPQYQAARRIAEEVVAGKSQDPTGGATHFLNPQLQAQLGRQQPAWATGQGTRIGGHMFYSRPGDFQRGGEPQPTQAGGVAARTGGTDVAGPAMPAGPQVGPNGLTQQQVAEVLAAEQARPGSGITLASQLKQQNLSNTRADEQLQISRQSAQRQAEKDRREQDQAGTKATAEAEATSFTRANTLRDEFTGLTKDYRAVQGAHTTLKEAGHDPTPAGDMSLLYQFNKMLDPGSVVRESEFATAARNGSLGTQMQAQVERLLSGQRLTDEQRKDILGQADRILKAQRRTYDQHRSQYRGLAERYKLDPDAVTPDFTLPDEAPQGGGGGQQRGSGYEDPRSLGMDGMPTVRTPEEAAALPPGTHYLTPDGRTFKR